MATRKRVGARAAPPGRGVDHPISWCRNTEGGRVWATAMGHTGSSFDEPELREHIVGGLRWAAGAEPGDCGGTVWNSFEKVTPDDNTADPMQLDVAPDGRQHQRPPWQDPQDQAEGRRRLRHPGRQSVGPRHGEDPPRPSRSSSRRTGSSSTSVTPFRTGSPSPTPRTARSTAHRPSSTRHSATTTRAPHRRQSRLRRHRRDR